MEPASRIDGPRTVLIDGDRIREVRELAATPAERPVHQVIDCRGRWVLPGLVDLHVHLREPGEEGKETIATGARAAAAGGVTTVIAMPNTKPVCDSAALARFVAARGREAGFARVVPAGAITRGSLGEQLADMAELKEAGWLCAADGRGPGRCSARRKRAASASPRRRRRTTSRSPTRPSPAWRLRATSPRQTRTIRTRR